METYTIKKSYHWTDDRDVEIQSESLIYAEMGRFSGVQCNGDNDEIRKRCDKIAVLIREIEDLNGEKTV